MESALSYLSGLVEAFEDVGKKSQSKRKGSKTSSAWDQTGIPACGIDVTNSTEDYCGGGCHEHDLEEGKSFEDGDDGIQHSESNVSGKRRRKQRHSFPSISEKKSFSGIIKSRGASLLQSFSMESSKRHENLNAPDVSKSRSSLSNTTKESHTECDDIEIDDTDFSWVGDLSFDSQDFAEHHPRKSKRIKNKKKRRPHLPPPPSGHHIQWFAHGILWTCMAITFGWVGVGLSYAARQSISFVEFKDPMYLDPRYEEIPAVGMIRMELCFNHTHLNILEELNDNDFRLEGERLELGAQPRTRKSDSTFSETHEYYARAVDDFVDEEDNDDDAITDEEAIKTCYIHRLTSDDIHDDIMYTVSQSVSFLSMVLGGFVTICLSFSAFWKTINLRPIGGGLVVAYFLQTFTFLIFDSHLCKDNLGCSMSGGGTLSAIASVCWILACAATARMDRRKFRNAEKEEAALEEKYRDYRRSKRRNTSQNNEDQLRPRQIVIGQEFEEDFVEAAAEELRKPTKPKTVSQENRNTTSETANLSSDEGSASNSMDSEQILQDLKETKEDPIYLPALPESPPTSDRSLKNNSKQSHDDENNENDIVEKQKKPKSKKHKSKSKKNQNLVESKDSPSSSSSREEGEGKKTKSSKKKSKKGRKSQQQRSRSPGKSIDMAGDVVDTIDIVDEHVRDIIKNSAWESDRTIEDIMNDTQTESSKPTGAKKRSSSRPRRSKSTPRPKNAAKRASVRQAIEEGKQYEL